MFKYKLQELDAKADIAEAKAIYAHAEQLSKNNSSKFIGALQASVRPVITYLLFSVFAFENNCSTVVSKKFLIAVVC